MSEQMFLPNHAKNHLPSGSDPIPDLGGTTVEDWIEPDLANGWSNVGGDYDDIAYRTGVSGLEFKGHIVGGAYNTVAFSLDIAHSPDATLSTITDVTHDDESLGAAQILITSDGDVFVNLIV